MECLHIREPDDSAWGENQYLCWSKNLPDPGYRFQWSYSSFRNFMDYVYAKVHCIKWDIGSYKPWSSWKDNYLCQPYVNYGKVCTIKDLCKNTPCKNGGQCEGFVGKYTCKCGKGFTGKNCETNIDDCKNNPCINNAKCIDNVNGYTCKCAAGFKGRRCETNIDECVGKTCKNGGTCVDKINNYVCKCKNGYAGKHCQINIDECAGNPCNNGGSCTDKVGGYICTCKAGYTGKSCQVNINECANV
ncbi:fibropellin-3-like [Hydractinia symbiolongicarpus]|uniref:fibropellin-3-like n=1 Tax=Hydractinia symbiolongicarpus TaxID=13093 RepID=UPI00254E7A4E|nr:fibropellin-3-like [Hydractinia symbiolongicarpus]